MSFSEFLTYFLLVAFTENVVFARGLGTSKSFKYMNNKKELLIYSASLLAILLPSSVISYFVSQYFLELSQNTKYIIFPAISVIVVTVFYFIVGSIISLIKSESWKSELYSLLPSSVYSYITIGTLMLQGRQNLSFLECITLSIASVFGFLVATLILSYSEGYLESDNIPKAFRGFPIKILFVGLVSLAFYGLSGHTLSF